MTGEAKGPEVSSISLVLEECSLRVTSIKIDPYLNTDAATMSPIKHGVVFVLVDGGEALEKNVKEKFSQFCHISETNIVTLYDVCNIWDISSMLRDQKAHEVILKELNLMGSITHELPLDEWTKRAKIRDRLKDLVVPHITDDIQEWIERVAKIHVDEMEDPTDVCVIELCETIGDIGSMPFIEILGQFSYHVGPGNFCLVQFNVVPSLNVFSEQVVSHITDIIQEWIERVAKIYVDGMEGPADVCVIKLGGTIGDIRSMSFIEALGQFSYRVGPGNSCFVHFNVVPVLNVFFKQALEKNVKEKLSQFCHISETNIVTLYNVCNI